MTIGQKAPAFRLQDHTGAWVDSASLKGKRVVLFFYPKDMTSGCTVEACEFRDLMPRFTAANAVLLWVRIREEEKALGPAWAAAFSAHPRFVPEGKP